MGDANSCIVDNTYMCIWLECFFLLRRLQQVNLHMFVGTGEAREAHHVCMYVRLRIARINASTSRFSPLLERVTFASEAGYTSQLHNEDSVWSWGAKFET